MSRNLPANMNRQRPAAGVLYGSKKELAGMFRSLLKSKIHRAAVTHCELHYEGSCAIDDELLDASGLVPNEEVHIWNVSNGERFVTYVISAQRGSGTISLNGSAARRAAVGDLVIIAAFAMVPEHDVAKHAPKLVFVDDKNRIGGLKTISPTQSQNEARAFSSICR